MVRNRFRVHRAVNDALAKAPFTPLPPGDRVRSRFIGETVARGAARSKGWVDRLVPDDLPLNVEAATFTPAGTALLGLRFPVTTDGEPILVELAGVPGMFDATPSWPEALGAYVLAGVTPPGTLTGFRAVAPAANGGYAAVIGSIDALGKGSVLLEDHPTGGEVTSRHVRFRLPDEGHLATGELVADLAPFHHVEGLAEVDGSCFYVTDEDHRVGLWTG